MIVSAAFVPSTPLLVPEAASGAAPELDGVRRASETALLAALDAGAQRVVVVGSVPAPGAGRGHLASSTRLLDRGTGSLRGFGVDLELALDPALPDPTPLSLTSTLGAWLVDRAAWPGERRALELAADAADPELDAAGRSLLDDGVPTALLVVADGSAARSEKAPASLHPDAEAFDTDVARALGSGDPALLAALDADRAWSVTAAGRPAWRAASAALTGPAYAADLLADAAPYGVGYLVAVWTRR